MKYEITEMYNKLMDKGTFKERLAEVLYLTPTTVKAWFPKGENIKEAYIPVVIKYLKLQIELDQENRQREVNGWELMK